MLLSFLTIILAVIFSLLSGLHVFWGLGGNWGSGEAAVPTTLRNEKIMNPGPVACFVVGLGLLSMGILILGAGKWILLPGPDWLISAGLMTISIIFTLRAIGDFQYVGFFKKIRKTTFGRMDSLYYSPLCFLLAIVSLLIALLR